MLALTCVNINLNNIIVVTPCMCCVYVYEHGGPDRTETRDGEEAPNVQDRIVSLARLVRLGALPSSLSKIIFHARSQWYNPKISCSFSRSCC